MMKNMRKNKSRIGLIAAGCFAALALYCTLITMSRVDDSDELALKQIASIGVVILWPLAFITWKGTDDKEEYGPRWGAIIFEALVICFVAWLVSAQVMYMEQRRSVTPKQFQKMRPK